MRKDHSDIKFKHPEDLQSHWCSGLSYNSRKEVLKTVLGVQCRLRLFNYQPFMTFMK